MKTTIPKFKSLPFEEGKTYITKFATGDKFKVVEIIIGKTGISKGKIIGFNGIYETAQHLGLCPLSADRLYPETIPDGTVDICKECREPL